MDRYNGVKSKKNCVKEKETHHGTVGALQRESPSSKAKATQVFGGFPGVNSSPTYASNPGAWRLSRGKVVTGVALKDR